MFPHLDVPDDPLADCTDGGSPFFDGGGLCCPDDLLDTVMPNLGLPDDGFLETLGIQVASPPPPLPAGRGGDAVSQLPTGGDAVADMELELDDVFGFFPVRLSSGGLDARGEGAPLLPALDAFGVFPVDDMVLTDMGFDGGLHPFGGGDDSVLPAHDDVCGLFPVDNMVLADAGTDYGGILQAFGDREPFPAHGVCGLLPAAGMVLTDAGTGGGHHTVSTTWETEARPPAFPLELDYVVPRKRRSRPANRRRNQSWSPNILLDAAVRVAAPRDSPSSNREHRGGKKVVAGGVRRRAVPRQRNRQSHRACSHCGRTDTPQWRAGPKGPGTLCNACGLRHNMGRLHEEYRPSTSPSFQSGKHSNRHRKVLKLMEEKAQKEALNKLMAANTTVPTPGACMSAACE